MIPKKVLDNRYTDMITYLMLPRQLTLPPHPPAKLTPPLSHSCRLFRSSKEVNSHQINSLQPLLQNTRGGGTRRRMSVALKRKNAILQVLCLPLIRTPCRVSPFLATHTQTPGIGVSRLLQLPLQCWQLQFCSPFVFRNLQIPFPATPFLSHPYKTPGVWGHEVSVMLNLYLTSVCVAYKQPGRTT